MRQQSSLNSVLVIHAEVISNLALGLFRSYSLVTSKSFCGKEMSKLLPGQSLALLPSPEEAAQTPNVIDELERRTKKLKAVRSRYPNFLDVQMPHNCLNFHLNIMKLASQSGKTYHARQIGLGVGGTGLDEKRCKKLYLSAMRFLFDRKLF